MKGHWWSVAVGCLIVVGALGGVPSAWAAPGDIVRTLHNPGAGDSFGYAVGSADGKVLVGDPRASTTYVFEGQTGLLLHTLQGGSWFGFCVTGAGNNALVGAIYSNEASIHDVDSGQLVRKWSGLGQQNFGYSVGALGSNAIVGATNQDGAGEAYLFDSQTGGLLATFHDPNPGAGGCFGYSVAGVGNKVVVGAPYLGSVYLFDSQTGSLLGSLANPNPGTGNYFGLSVAAVGGKVVVGTPLEESGATPGGAAYVFDAATGSLLQTLTNPNASVGDQFGSRVAGVDGNALVGAPLDDTAGTDAGAAYLFDVSSGDPLLSLYNPAPAEGGLFGQAVAGLGKDIIVGYGTTGRSTVYLFEGVPEPATLSLLALGGALALLRRRSAGSS